MAKLSWRWEAVPAGIDLQLLEKPLIGRTRLVPPADWAERVPASAAAVARFARLVEEDQAEITDASVCLSHDGLAELDDAMAGSVGLPAPPPFLLKLAVQGLITDPGFSLETRFVGIGDVPVRPAPIREGTLLRHGSAVYRLPRPLPDILDAADALVAVPAQESSARMAALANIKRLLPQATERWARPDGYLQTLRVAVPAAFSLRLTTLGGRFDLDPLLFGREAIDEASRDGVTPSEARMLLAPVEDEEFRRQFREEDEALEAYTLARGTYLFLPPMLRAALRVVREVQQAEPAVREAFARQPQRHLKERLGDRFDQELIDGLFFETDQYSERVLGLGLWQPPVLPWLIPATNSWLPERFGLRIGDRTVEIPFGRIREVGSAIDEAIAADRPEAVVSGISPIPATAQAKEAVSELERHICAANAESDGETAPLAGTEVPPAIGKLVLLTKHNLEDIGFQRQLSPRGAPLLNEPPATLASTLKAHQRVGLHWLQDCWRAGEPGVLLADDMGLGKTLQALCFLAWLRGVGGLADPVLVVAPTGLLANWKAEEARHLARPGLGDLIEAYGAGLRQLRTSQSEEARGAGSLLESDQLRAAGWILTTYETLRDYEQSFGKVRFACVVFDELQKVKNPAALVHKAANAVNADFALGLTGTPVENRIEDLWAVLEPLRPGELGDLKSFSQRHPPDDLDAMQGLRARLLDDTAERRAPILRRLKADALDGLPEKREHRRPAPMPRSQAESYARVVAEARAGRLDGLTTLHNLRGISLHPEAAGPGLDDETWIAGSARLREAISVLDGVVDRKEKALVFCESLGVQERLADLLYRRYGMPRRPSQITGQIAGARRQKMVDAFQAGGRGFDVILLTPRAGGVGLTLTAANHVIHLSRWWNPAVEDQCTDRVFRIGQERQVNVWYPMAVHPMFPGGSFDEALDALLERKRNLTRRLLIPPVGPNDEDELLRATLG